MQVKSGQVIETAGVYKCTNCGKELTFKAGDVVPHCPQCGNDTFNLKEEA